jgi:hypothetical protein
LVAVGSSLKFCFIAEGSADFYPRFGPTSEWDTAAAQAVVEAALAQASVSLAARAAHQPALSWGTSEGTHRSLSLWLAKEEAPRYLPFTRALIEDCGAGARRRQTYARAYILRSLRQMGLFSH